MTLLRGLGLLAFVMSATATIAAPHRIVSINPCVDAILVEVADLGQIAGISHYSQQARATSIPLTLARRFKATTGTAEEVMALAPDMVISGGHVAPSTLMALRRLGIPLLELQVPDSIADSRAQIVAVARAAGHPERGRALQARIDAALEAAQPADQEPLRALIWQGGGLVPGMATLANELLARAGFHNISGDYGLQKWDVLPLERLLAQPPAVLLSASGADAKDDRMLSHPALAGLGGRITIRQFPYRLLQCGGPTIIPALAQLAAVRRGLAMPAATVTGR